MALPAPSTTSSARRAAASRMRALLLSPLSRLLLLALLLVALAPSPALASCSAKDGPVTCKPCAKTRSINDVKSMLRVDRNFALTTNNMAYYDIYSCTDDGTGAGRDCKTVSSIDWNGTESTNPLNYAVGLLAYTAFGFLFVIIVLIFFLSLCICRYCCCCLLSPGGLGCCGKTYPTQRGLGTKSTGRICGCCCDSLGFEENPDAASGFSYSKRGQWCTRLAAWIFIALVVSFICAGHFAGNAKFGSSFKTAARSPGAAAQMAANLGPVFTRLTVNHLGPIVSSFVTSLIDLVDQSIDPPALIANVTCVADGVASFVWPDSFQDSLDTSSAARDAARTAIVNIVHIDRDSSGNVETSPTPPYPTNSFATWTNMCSNFVSTASQLSDPSDPSSTAPIDVMQRMVTTTGATLDPLNSTMAALVADDKALFDPTTGIYTRLATLASGIGAIPNQGTVGSGASNAAWWRDTPAGSFTGASVRGPRQDAINTLLAIHTAYQTINVDTITSDVAALTAAYEAQIATLRSDNQAALTAAQNTKATLPVFDRANMVTQVNVAMDALVTISGDLPSGPALVNVLADIDAGADTVNSTEIKSADVDALIDLAQSIVTCGLSVMQAGTTLNTTVLALPDDVLGSLAEAQVAQTELNTFTTALGTVLGQIDDARHIAFDQVDIATRRTELDTGLAMLQTCFAATNADRLQDDPVPLNALYTLRDAIDQFQNPTPAASAPTIEQVIAYLQARQAALNARTLIMPSISSTGVDQLNALQGYVTPQDLATLATVVSDMQRMTQGYCAVDPNTLCYDTSVCPSGACVDEGVRRCRLAQATPCTTDAECMGAGDACMADTARLTAVHDWLATLQTVSPDPTLDDSVSTLAADVAAVMNQDMATANAAYLASSPLQEFANNADAADANLAPGSTGLTTFSTQVSNLITGATTLDNAAMLTNLVLMDTVLMRVDYASLSNSGHSLDSEISNAVAQALPHIQQVQAFVQAYINTAIDYWPGNSTRLSTASLSALAATNGGAAPLVEIAAVLDEASAVMNANQTLYDTRIHIGDSSIVRWTLDAMAKIDQSVLNQGGPIYFLLQLAGKDQIPLSDTTRGRWDKDAAGRSYTGGRKCYTLDCLDASVKYIEDEPLNDSTEGLVPILLTRPEAFAVPYVIPAVICLVLLLATLCGWRGGRGAQKASVHLTNCSLCLMFCQNVFGFLLIGAFLFPVLLLTGDVCQSFANVGHRVIYQRGNTVCTDVVGGTGSLSACAVTVARVNTTINLGAAYDATLSGTCTGVPASDPFARFWADARAEIVNLPKRELDDRVADPNDSTFSQLQAPTKQAVLNASAEVGAALQSVVTDLSLTMGCAATSKSVTDMQDAFCCEFAEAVYWMVAGWYLILWATCICGIPIALFGRKRFPAEPWGPEYEACVQERKRTRADDDGLLPVVDDDGKGKGKMFHDHSDPTTVHARNLHAISTVELADNGLEPGFAAQAYHVPVYGQAPDLVDPFQPAPQASVYTTHGDVFVVGAANAGPGAAEAGRGRTVVRHGTRTATVPVVLTPAQSLPTMAATSYAADGLASTSEVQLHDLRYTPPDQY